MTTDPTEPHLTPARVQAMIVDTQFTDPDWDVNSAKAATQHGNIFPTTMRGWTC